MKLRNPIVVRPSPITVIVFVLALFSVSLSAQTETVLRSFSGTPGDGGSPVEGLVLDANGNLYGTTQQGGTYGYGTAFKLTTNGSETILHNF